MTVKDKVVIITGAGFPMVRLEHAVTMFIAAIVAHNL